MPPGAVAGGGERRGAEGQLPAAASAGSLSPAAALERKKGVWRVGDACPGPPSIHPPTHPSVNPSTPPALAGRSRCLRCCSSSGGTGGDHALMPTLLYPAASMAVARKIKTLLTVNILVFVGIILFSVYCRIQDRSQELVQIVRSADRRMRSRNAKVGTLLDRDAILQRLDHLEEVVYNQLNGKGRGQRGGEGSAGGDPGGSSGVR